MAHLGARGRRGFKISDFDPGNGGSDLPDIATKVFQHRPAFIIEGEAEGLRCTAKRLRHALAETGWLDFRFVSINSNEPRLRSRGCAGSKTRVKYAERRCFLL